MSKYPKKLIKIQAKCFFSTCNNIVDVYSPGGEPVFIRCKEHQNYINSNKFTQKQSEANEFRDLKAFNLLDEMDLE